MTASKNQRKSLRLKHWDYKTAGLYFVTICINNRKNLFGEIKNDKMILNDAGVMIDEQWQNIFTRFQNAKTQQYIIMPNHFHAIIKIVGVPLVGTQNAQIRQLEIGQSNQTKHVQGQPQGIAPTLGEIIGAFKSITTNEYIQGVKQSNWQQFDKKLWQRNYYEHVIRDAEDFNRISEYIETNPLKWELDSLHPNNLKVDL